MSGTYRFFRAAAGTPDLAADVKIALIATCVAEQQAAGFGAAIDLRQFECPMCKAPGFNSGWGYFRFTCGAEILTGEDGDVTEPCGAEVAA